MRLPEGVAPRLARPVLADRLQVKGRQLHSFGFPGLNDQAITRTLLGKGNGIKLCPFLEHRSSNMAKEILRAGDGGARLWG